MHFNETAEKEKKTQPIKGDYFKID